MPNSIKTQCGTPGYVAPEILKGVLYGVQADMWSLGVITYILLGGYPPFIEDNQKNLFRKIRQGEWEFHPQYWGNVSKEAKELIKEFVYDAEKKMQEALEKEQRKLKAREKKYLQEVKSKVFG